MAYIFVIVSSLQPYSNIQRKQLTYQYIVQPCQVQPDNISFTTQFTSIFPNAQQAQNITISGWFLLYGYQSNNYVIFSIHEQNQTLMALLINLKQKQLIFNLQGQESVTQNTSNIVANRWFFMVVTLSCSSGNIQVNGGAYFYRSYINLSGLSKSYSNQYLLLQNMEFNSGNPPKRLNVQPSCSLYKQLAIEIDSYNQIQSTSKIEDYLAKQESSLIMHYDYFYSQQNPGQLLSDIGTRYQRLSIQDQLLNNTISSTNRLDTQLIELEGLNEFIISFFIKFQQIASFNFLTLILPDNLVTFSQYFNNIVFGSAQVQFDISKWIHVIIHYSQYSSAPLSLIIQGNEQNMQSISLTSGTSVFQLKFKQSSNNQYQLNHIRIYKGSLIYSFQNCLLQSADGTCILCKSNYLLDFQNNMSCVIKSQINTDSEINGIKDWNPPRKICPSKMINDNSSLDGCKCILGYYFQDQQCVLCPSYCRYCNSPNDCNLTRDKNGNCLNPNAFDDGDKCILPYLSIPSKDSQFRFVMKKPDFGQSCSNMDVQSKYQYYGQNFNLQQQDSIFFSFAFQVMSINGKINNTVIAWVKQNSVFILSIILSYVSDTNGVPLLTVQFNIKNKFYKDYIFYISDPAWIGFWTDKYNYLLLFRSNQINNQFEFTDTEQFFTSPDLQFCIGYCDQLVNGCLSLLSNSITFIRNLNYSTQQGIDQMFSLYRDDTQLIGRYKFDQKYSNFLKEIINSSGNSNNPSVKLIFSQNLQKYNKIQGFQISQSVQASLTYSGNSYGITTISLNLEMDSKNQYSQFLFINLSFTQGGYSFQVVLVPDYLLQIIRVRVCFDSQCFSTQKAVLLFDQPNFFFITFSGDLKQMYKQYVLLYKVDVICNYTLEQFTFASQKTNFQLGFIQFGSNTASFQIFLDNISIYSQNGFVYYDFTQTEPCHIYINVSNNKCLHLKRQYLYFNNRIITQQQCAQLSRTTQNIPVINLKDQTCDLIIPMSPSQYLCGQGEYVNGQFICILCKDANADPLKQCQQCQSHFFYDKLTQLCQECDYQCKECIDSSSQCTQCESINQITPKCDCISQPITGQNTCQCNYKCGSCSYSDSNICITCSSEKRIMPNCLCDSQYIELNDECINLNCSYKCQSCSQSNNNCTKCSVNRINPPLCICNEGFQEDQNGICQPCPTGTFFDSNLKNCQNCSSQCLSCNQYECLQCAGGFQKQGQQCVCPNQLLYNLDSKNMPKCLKTMDLYLNYSKQNQKHLIKFMFEKPLTKFNLQEFILNKIVRFYIPEISDTYYDVVNPIYDENTFQLEIKINQNFYATSCVVIIYQNQFFISDDDQFILRDSYVNSRLIVGIGPFLFKSENQDNLHLDNINGYLSELKKSNSGLFQIINQFQIVFYLLNTLQPISVFLLLDIIYPPQLYKLYQFIGNFVFPQVPDYLAQPSEYNFRLLGYQIQGIDSKQPNFGKFKNYGFCLSLLDKLSLAVKFLGELILSAAWFLHIPLLAQEKTFKIQSVIEDDELKKYLDIGNVILGENMVSHCHCYMYYVQQQMPTLKKVVTLFKQHNNYLAIVCFIENNFIYTNANADPLKQCQQCQSNLFYDKLTQLCKKCDYQCQEYIDRLKICQGNYKCDTCSYSDSNICISCLSYKRAMPNCLCDSQYIELNGKCINLNYTYKYLSRSQINNNCTKCAVNRINLPLHNCSE
ncbi:hypothetical protein ABPG73_004319 [Tetrahymena malaccensis]